MTTSYPLAVVTPSVGAVSETFIRRHVNELLPGRTVVLTRSVRSDASWTAEGPLLEFDQRPSLGRRGVEAVTRRLWTSSTGQVPSGVVRFLKRHHVEAIFAEYLDVSLRWLDCSKDLGLRFYVHAHGYDVSRCLQEKRWRHEYVRYNQADAVIVVSQHHRQRLLDLGLAPSRVHVVPCGVDVDLNHASKPRDSCIRCLAVGRMVPKKGIIFLLDAFRRASERHKEMRLDVVGGGPLFAAASQFVHTFNLHSRVTLHGSQPNEYVLRMMDNADVFLQHSVTSPIDGDEEGLPVAILEAMAHRLPVISTSHAGIPEAVRDGLTGYLVAEGDAAGMAGAIVHLARNRRLRAAAGHAGFDCVRAEFSAELERDRLRTIMGLSE